MNEPSKINNTMNQHQQHEINKITDINSLENMVT